MNIQFYKINNTNMLRHNNTGAKYNYSVPTLKNDTVCFSGRKIPLLYEDLVKKISQTPDCEIIDLQHAAKELSTTDIKDNDKVQMILSCIINNRNYNQVSKKLLLILLHKYLKGIYNPEIKNLRKCYVYDKKRINYDTLGQLLSDSKETRDISPSRYNMLHLKNKILNNVHATSPFKDFELDNIFTPLEIKKRGLSLLLDECKSDISEDLYKNMQTSLLELDFNLSDVYKDYYSKIYNIHSFEELKKLYPEIKFNCTTPKKEDRKNFYFINKNDYMYYIFGALKKAYCKLIPKTEISLFVSGSRRFIKLYDLKNIGYDISTPSEKILSLFEKCEYENKIIQRLAELSQDTIEKLAANRALVKSGYATNPNSQKLKQTYIQLYEKYMNILEEKINLT